MPGDYASLNESSVAGTVAAEYVGSERMKFSTRLEARRATSLDSYLHTAAVAYKLSPDWTLLLRNGVQLDKAATATPATRPGCASRSARPTARWTTTASIS